MISPQLRNGLEYLSRLMAGASEPWWIIGSTAMVLIEVDDIEPDDIDVVASGVCLRQLLAKTGIAPALPTSHKKFRSVPYQRISITNGTEIELMGDLAVHDGIKFQPLIIHSRVKIMIGECEVYVPERTEQIAIFNLFGREKDLAKAAILMH